MDTENIIELHRHIPDVETIVSRLNWHKDKIKNIVTIVEWDDGQISQSWNAMSVMHLLYFATYFYENTKEIAIYGNDSSTDYYTSQPPDEDDNDGGDA